MDEILAALQAQQDELGALVTGRHVDLTAPSRCPGWSVADVVLHLAQTNEMAVASIEGRMDEFGAAVAADLPAHASIDDLAGLLVEAERSTPAAARDRWLASADAQLAAFAGCEPSARVVWVAGEMAARTLATTRLTECWIHTVDVAVAFGPPPPPTDRLRHTARLVWRTVPYALAQESLTASGPVAFELDAPDGSTWTFGDVTDAVTVVRGSAVELCTVAGQRASAADTGLSASGPDADVVLRLMRTFA